MLDVYLQYKANKIGYNGINELCENLVYIPYLRKLWIDSIYLYIIDNNITNTGIKILSSSLVNIPNLMDLRIESILIQFR